MGAFCNTLTFIKLHVACVIKIFVLSIFEWPFYTGFTVFFLFSNKMLVISAKVLKMLV